jgi:predicted nucleic acid-binding protein
VSVLIDTSVWSLALRRQSKVLSHSQSAVVEEWRRLALAGDAHLTGLIRQELLSGIRDDVAFEFVQARLASFTHLVTTMDDHDQAARMFSTLRRKGVAATSVDLLICALAIRHDFSVFTLDADFERYARGIPLKLHRFS